MESIEIKMQGANKARTLNFVLTKTNHMEKSKFKVGDKVKTKQENKTQLGYSGMVISEINDNIAICTFYSFDNDPLSSERPTHRITRTESFLLTDLELF